LSRLDFIKKTIYMGKKDTSKAHNLSAQSKHIKQKAATRIPRKKNENDFCILIIMKKNSFTSLWSMVWSSCYGDS